MDQALATANAIAEAVLIAGTIGVWLAILQERIFGQKLEGNNARYLSIAAALVVGIFATARTGGFVIIGDANDPIGTAASILASAGIVLAASQAAFRVFVKPLAA
jgi:hypothetical protein